MSLFTTLRSRRPGLGRWLAVAGGALIAISAFLAWSYGDALDNMTYYGSPSPLQWLVFVVGIVILVSALLAPGVAGTHGEGPLARVRGAFSRFDLVGGAVGASVGAFATILLIVILLALEQGGLINIDPGGWVALVGALLAGFGSLAMPRPEVKKLGRVLLPSWAEIGVIVILMAAVLFAAAIALNATDGGVFISLLIVVGSLVAAAKMSGVLAWLGAITRRHRTVLVFSAFVVAFMFPFTQGSSDANMSIATQVIVFAATAMGLNIVVGLAGLLDLGYIAFLGAGAFTAAVLSESVFSTVSWHPPFIVVVVLSGLISATLGLIIGSPTLRVSGDYLAIVTLAFGEIFRLTMINLDGQDGPKITRGSNGIPGIPDLNIFGWDLGAPLHIGPFVLGRFANYYFILLVLIAVIILIFVRLNSSRIGRGWIAIREDEKAAEAMGVNVFGLKLLAFSGGAFLAGIAGSLKAHVDQSVTPDSFVFLESAFLLAAIVLGGMGTVLGVLVGATLLKLLPEKLRFVQDYRLMIFGLLLVLMMRYRPEGLVPSDRRRLEFHEDDDDLAAEVGAEHLAETRMREAQA